MVDMDLKGITWVGHVYQKFEAVCLEVEEIMYQVSSFMSFHLIPYSVFLEHIHSFQPPKLEKARCSTV